MFVLETRQLSRTYRAGTAEEIRALVDVSLEINAGSLVVLTGPSGAGKTTLLALLGALERPTGGRVIFAGRDLHDCSDYELARLRRRMGWVFQQFALIPELPAWENITYPLIPRGVRRSERRRRADELLGQFGLANRLWARPTELSGGEQQRVAIARALAGRPEVVFADEPTSNLDPAAGGMVIDLLRQINAAGTTVIASSHDNRLASIAVRTLALEVGRLRLDQTG